MGTYAGSLPLNRVKVLESGPGAYGFDQVDILLAYILTLATVNFGSGYFPRLRKRPGMSGYFTVASRLRDYFHGHGSISAEDMTAFTPERCARIFHQDTREPPVAELMSLFSRALNDLGQFLLDRFQGSFAGLVLAADRSAESLVGLLTKMPYFNDVGYYGRLQVPFYKRAQLAASDLYLALKSNALCRFEDMDRLTIFADNLVPHVLRVDGLMSYEKSLSDRIDRGELIPGGSQEEIEIRACALHAGELLVGVLRAAGHDLKAFQVDNILWNRGQQAYYKGIGPRHRTRGVFY
jgi:hypothetical protein